MSDPRKKYVGCPRCATLHRIFKGSEREYCKPCRSHFNPQTKEVLEVDAKRHQTIEV